jgi:hypothetical protein
MRSRSALVLESTERLVNLAHGDGGDAGAYRYLGIERNFVAASDKVCGAHDDPPHRDSTTLEPRHPYDVSKAAAGPAGISYWFRLAGGSDTRRERVRRWGF